MVETGLNGQERENKKKYALISVYDKTGIEAIAKVLADLDYQIISTGGTAKVICEFGIEVIPISDITGSPEAFDGRMKTISFQIESGILFDRSNPDHISQAQGLNIPQIDIVVCNLYPFLQVIRKPGLTMEEAINNIDVGGVTLIRAAAKNWQHVLVVVDPDDYNQVGKALQTDSVNQQLRLELAQKAFQLTAQYDQTIATYYQQQISQ